MVHEVSGAVVAEVVMVALSVSLPDVCALLDMLGHDFATFDNSIVHRLVMEKLYPTFHNLGKQEVVDIEVNEDELYMIHRYFTPREFGEGGRNFQCKIARAATELNEVDTLPEWVSKLKIADEELDAQGFTEQETRDLLYILERDDDASTSDNPS